jgi:hypothetical protein
MSDIDDFEKEFKTYGIKPARYTKTNKPNKRGQSAGVNSKMVAKAIERERKKDGEGTKI